MPRGSAATIMSRLLEQIDEARRTRGVLGVPGELARKLCMRLRYGDRQMVFVHARRPERTRPFEGLVAQRCTRIEEVPSRWFEQLLVFGESARRAFFEKEFSRGCVLWAASDGQQLAGYLWMNRGRTISRWLVPLGADDIAVFNTNTLPEWRGRGVMAWLINEAIAGERSGAAGDAGERCYISCVPWNRASRRMIEKSGFELVGLHRMSQGGGSHG